MIHNWKIGHLGTNRYYVYDRDVNCLKSDGSVGQIDWNDATDLGWYKTRDEAQLAIDNFNKLHCTDIELRIPERFRKFVRSERSGSSAVFEEFVSRLEDKKDEGLRSGCDTDGNEGDDPEGSAAVPAEQQGEVSAASCQPSTEADDSKPVEGE